MVWLRSGTRPGIGRLTSSLSPKRLAASLDALRGDATQKLVALTFNSSTSFVAGLFLASITGTLERLPGLLVLVPAAIGLRGNVFSALGNRLSTAIHVGTFRISARPESVLGQNVVASFVLTLGVSLLLAVSAKTLGVGLGLDPRPGPLLDLALVAILGGLLASVVVLSATLLLARASVRYDWDLDNLVAPSVSTLGDLLTLPGLWLASALIDIDWVSTVLGAVLMVTSALALGWAWRTPLDVLRRVTRESFPVLVIAALLSTLAGLALEKQLTVFTEAKALFLLQLSFVSSAGALGGILASRLSTGFQLGTFDPELVPGRPARREVREIIFAAVPIVMFNALGSHSLATLFGYSSPGAATLLVAAFVAGAVTLAFVLSIAYYGTLAAYRVGVDPDNYGIPIVTSSVDFIGALSLVVTVVSLNLR
jgi:mgtE-like transporter